MATSSSPAISFKFPFLFFLLISLCSISDSYHNYKVGGSRGWIKPTGNETETYNDWAMANRFHIGDSIHFDYRDDSVVEVHRDDYWNCSSASPIFRSDDGNTTVKFDRYGFFYFISGNSEHCELGQRMIIRVMVHPEVEPPRIAVGAPPGARGFRKGCGHGWKTSNGAAPYAAMVNLASKKTVGWLVMTFNGLWLIL